MDQLLCVLYISDGFIMLTKEEHLKLKGLIVDGLNGIADTLRSRGEEFDNKQIIQRDKWLKIEEYIDSLVEK